MILVPHCEVERLDRELTLLSRSAGALRLAVGEALRALTSTNGHFELGFPSLEAYALERCERSGRWAAESASVATRLTRLPSARRALIAGTISWSAAQLLASKVEPEQEASWVELARRASYRALRKALGAAHARESGQHSESDPADQSPPVEQPDPIEQADCALTVTMDIDEAWLFESTRMLMARIAGERLNQDQLVQCLCAEALGDVGRAGFEARDRSA